MHEYFSLASYIKFSFLKTYLYFHWMIHCYCITYMNLKQHFAIYTFKITQIFVLIHWFRSHTSKCNYISRENVTHNGFGHFQSLLLLLLFLFLWISLYFLTTLLRISFHDKLIHFYFPLSANRITIFCLPNKIMFALQQDNLIYASI